MDEINLNFRARQATIYNNGQLVASLTGEDFAQFEDLRSRFEQACVKKPEQIEKERLDEIKRIDDQIAELTTQKEALNDKKTP